MTKRALIAFTNVGVMAVAELPYILKRAGYHVTLMGLPRRRISVGSFYDAWLAATDNPRETVARLGAMLQRRPDDYDWIILGDDPLLRALKTADLPDDVKTRMSFIGRTEALQVLGSKTETSTYCQAHAILTPPFVVCQNVGEIKAAVEKLGYPVMVKADLGQCGDGVYCCRNAKQLADNLRFISDNRFLVEKQIEGEQIGVEPLYVKGKLVAYNSARIVANDPVAGLETRRTSVVVPELIPVLEKLGAVFKLNGFCNLGFIRSAADRQFYLFEADMRANAWVSYGRYWGVDFAAALRGDAALQAPKQNNVDVRIFYREIEQYVRELDFAGLWKWVTNAHNRWRYLPTYDPGFTVRTLLRIMLKAPFTILKNYRK